MLHIVWNILKIAGIILAVVLGILLLLMLLLLFVPVRYQINAKVMEEKDVRAKVSWLLKAFGVNVRYTEGKLSVVLKLFWFLTFQIYPAKEPGPQGKKTRSEKGRGREKEAPTEIAFNEELSESNIQEEDLSGTAGQVELHPNEKSSEENVQSREGKIICIFRRIMDIPGKMICRLRSILEKLKYTFRTICVKIGNIRANWNYYVDILQKEETRNAFSLCRRQLMRLLRHVAPRKVSGEIRFGFADPAQTGQIYGLYCASSVFHRYSVRMEPDFEEKIFQGQVHVKGRIRGITVLVFGLQILFDKNIRYLIKELKQS